MALSDRDGDLLLLLLGMLVAERDDLEFDGFDPFFAEILFRLERDFEKSERSSGLSTHFLFSSLRRDFLAKGPKSPRSRLQSQIDQLYGHVEGRFGQLGSEVGRRFADLSSELRILNARIDRGAEENMDLSISVDSASDALKTLQWALSVGADPSQMRLNRSVPVRIFLSDNVPSEITSPIVSSIMSALESLSFEEDIELPEEGGSWWKRIWVKSKDLATQEEVQERLIKLERAAETKLLEKPQAEANKDHAHAVATIIKSLEHVNSACVQIGNILLVKHIPEKPTKGRSAGSSYVAVRTLSAIEMRALEKNQTLLRDPAGIIQKLEHACAAENPALRVGHSPHE